MRFSVFTPTHHPVYLGEAYQSLLTQTFTDWEWVVVPNNGAFVDDPAITNDPRVDVRRPPTPMLHGVGALKAYACQQTRGDYLVELDHDDLLVPSALQEISDAIDATQATFLYSDCVEFRTNGDSHVYDKKWGWEHYDTELRINGNPQHKYTVNKAFDPTPSSLSQIFYAPNHIRVWQRELYETVGGHDPQLGVCDDFDLVCRSYLHGAKFHFIPNPIYLYRMSADGNQTYLKRNAEIQTKQAEIGDRYRRSLIEKWCANEGLPMWDLGGGVNPHPGFESIDLIHGDDVLQRLRVQPENTIGCVRAHDFLEHIPHCRDSRCTHHNDNCVVELMNQIYRVLVPGGWLVTMTPSTDGRGAFQDPTHCSFWNENSWFYYTRQEQQKFVPGIKARFQATRIYTSFPNEWCRKHNIPYVYADVVALKGQRQPGLVELPNAA